VRELDLGRRQSLPGLELSPVHFGEEQRRGFQSTMKARATLAALTSQVDLEESASFKQTRADLGMASATTRGDVDHKHRLAGLLGWAV